LEALISGGYLLEPNESRRGNAAKKSCVAVPDALSVDVEDYYQVEAFADCISPFSWSSYPSRVRLNTERVLQILDDYSCRGTFFVLGWVAERDPALVATFVWTKSV
jgi:peptidoglycan/xylan/chitin deacetylase (PgdA/CDA1 family)